MAVRGVALGSVWQTHPPAARPRRRFRGHTLTAKPLLGTSNMAMPPSIAVRALSDASLAKEICDLEQLLTSNPAMATHIQPPLERHVAERARRVACADEEALAEVCAPTDAPDAPDAPDAAEAAPGSSPA